LYKKYKDVVIGGVLAVLSFIYIAMSFQIKLTNIDRIVGSRLFPQICGVLILALSVYLIVYGIKQSKSIEAGDKEPAKNYTKTVIVLGSYAAYIFLMDKIGFTLSSILYLFSQMIVMGKWPVKKKSMAIYLVIAVVGSAVIYIMFDKVFMLMLPRAGWL